MLSLSRSVTRPKETTHDLSDDAEFNSPSSSPTKKRSPIQNSYRDTVMLSNSSSSNRTFPAVADRDRESHSSALTTLSTEENYMLFPSEVRIESAETTIKEIGNDKSEAQRMIVTYGIHPAEILHMGKFFHSKQKIVSGHIF